MLFWNSNDCQREKLVKNKTGGQRNSRPPPFRLDSFQYFGRSQKYRVLTFSSTFPVSVQFLWDNFKGSSYYGYHCHFHVPVYQFSDKVQVFIKGFFYCFLFILLCALQEQRSSVDEKYFFLVNEKKRIWFGLLVSMVWSIFIPKSHRILRVLFSWTFVCIVRI